MNIIMLFKDKFPLKVIPTKIARKTFGVGFLGYDFEDGSWISFDPDNYNPETSFCSKWEEGDNVLLVAFVTSDYSVVKAVHNLRLNMVTRL